MKKWIERINHWKLDKKMQVLVTHSHYCYDLDHFGCIHHFLSNLDEGKIHRTAADKQ